MNKSSMKCIWIYVADVKSRQHFSGQKILVGYGFVWNIVWMKYVDPDQLTSSEADCTGSALFSKVEKKQRLCSQIEYGINYFLASSNFCRLLITFANCLDPDQDPDLDSNPDILLVLLKNFLIFFIFSQQMTTKAWKNTQHAKSEACTYMEYFVWEFILEINLIFGLFTESWTNWVSCNVKPSNWVSCKVKVKPLGLLQS